MMTLQRTNAPRPGRLGSNASGATKRRVQLGAFQSQRCNAQDRDTVCAVCALCVRQTSGCEAPCRAQRI